LLDSLLQERLSGPHFFEGLGMKGPVSAPPVDVQFAQKLAANDKKDRDRAVKKLKKWFGARSSGFPQDELMRIWKGLFYCYWMSDKPLVQEELAENISSMVASFQTSQDGLGFVQAFAKTFQREWFGVDRWRMDKTMMLVRRFLRHSLKLVAKAEWEEVLLEAFIDVIRKEVILTDPANASLGFQLHFTDVFLEEVAKVGGEDLPAKVVGKLVQPWVDLVATSTDLRLIVHTEERIFNHLLRQSDPGIKYQMEEDGLEEEEEEVSEANGAENGSTENGNKNGHKNGDGESDEEEDDNDGEGSAEDPRAGRVSVVIPQVAVDYAGIADNLFQLGSKENMRKSNRDMLYRVSKKFKDVAANIFPLGPNLEELESIEIPKISVKKSAAELAKRQAQIRRENLESKKRAKKMKLKEEEAPSSGEESGKTNGKAGSEEEEVHDEEEEDENATLEQKVGESDEEKDDEEDEPTEKKVKRENQKKKKQERKRKKREALLKAALEKAEQERKVENQLGHDLEINSALVKKNLEGKDKKRKHDAPITNGHTRSPVKKAKIENGEPNGEVKAIDINQNVPEQVKKKKKEKSVHANGKEANEDVKKVEENKTNDSKKASNSIFKEVTDKEEGKKISESVVEAAADAESNMTNVEEEAGQLSDAGKKLKKKKKKSKKEMHRIDSDISFSAPSLSKTNLSLAEKPTPAPMTPIAEADTPTHVPMTPTAESPKSTPETAFKSKASPSEETPRLKKKKMKKSKGMASLQEGTPNKVFEEPTWDSPLLPGEQELVLPNKSYKGTEKLAPPAVAPEINGFEPSQITPVKSFTSTFLKKAVSKSGTPKKSKKDRLQDESAKKELSNSAPQKKRINFALTQNKAQDFVEHLRQVKSSPQTPHDPDKKPTKKLLKKKESLESSAKKLNPVGLNTQLNSRSKTAKILQKRARAMDFF